jgi:hypothetical protein
MADTIFDKRANPDVTTTATTTQNAPSYYTDYLSGLSQAGKTAIANPNQVAPLTEMQQQGWAATPGAATAYRPGLTAAEGTAGTAAAGAAPQIGDFMNPYTSNVVDEMERLQQQNIQRNLMPQLKAGFVSTGGLGSSRYANALGQTMSDLQSNLTGQQYGALSKGYSDSVTAALNNAQLQNQAARTQGDLAGQEQALGLGGAGALTKAGTEQQMYDQSLIDAPLKTATNASQLMRGYTVPGSSSVSTSGPMQSTYYQGSPLSQTLGVSSMLGSLYGRPKNSSGILGDVASYFGGAASSAGKSLSNWWNNTPSGTTSQYEGLNNPDAMNQLTNWTYDPAGDANYGSNYDPTSGQTYDEQLQSAGSSGMGGYYDDNWNWIPEGG